jgi:hypothetical protein
MRCALVACLTVHERNLGETGPVRAALTLTLGPADENKVLSAGPKRKREVFALG